MTTHKYISACTRDCPDTCSLVVTKRKDGSFSFNGNPDHPITKGFICAKTMRYPALMQHEKRITTPLIREGANYWPVSFEEAIQLIANHINALRQTPEKILHIHGYGYRGILAQASEYFFSKIGSATTSGNPCDAAGTAACIADFGILTAHDPQDLKNTKRIVNWGRDLRGTSIHKYQQVQQLRRSGIQVLTISLAEKGVSSFSDKVVCIRPGTDRFLAAALIKALIKRGVPQELQEACANFHELADCVYEYNTKDLLAACGVSKQDFEYILRFYTADGPTNTIVGLGLQRYLHGGESVRFINAVALFSGNIGIAGGGSNYSISSARNFSPWFEKTVAKRRTFPLHNLGQNIIKAVPSLDMIWVDGTNIINQLPESHTLAEAFSLCPLVVVVDSFFTDTALRADIILPCALPGEREDVLGSSWHNYINYTAKVLSPPGLARSDWDIIEALGKSLAEPVLLPEKKEALERALSSPTLNTTLQELKEKGFSRSNWPEVPFAAKDGTLCFAHKDKKFHAITKLSPLPALKKDFPLFLLTLVDKHHIHSQKDPDCTTEPPIVFVSPENPVLRYLNRAKPVFLVSPSGRLAVTVETDTTLHPEAVFLRRGGWMQHKQNANPIIQSQLTDMGGGIAYYSQNVRLEN